MIINLKQSEITAALRMYVERQGINLTGKTIAVDFTAGRKETGISAELTIEEINTAPQPEYVGSIAKAVAIVQEPVMDPEDMAKAAEVETEAVGEAKTTSLFGN